MMRHIRSFVGQFKILQHYNTVKSCFAQKYNMFGPRKALRRLHFRISLLSCLSVNMFLTRLLTKYLNLCKLREMAVEENFPDLDDGVRHRCTPVGLR